MVLIWPTSHDQIELATTHVCAEDTLDARGIVQDTNGSVKLWVQRTPSLPPAILSRASP